MRLWQKTKTLTGYSKYTNSCAVVAVAVAVGPNKSWLLLETHHNQPPPALQEEASVLVASNGHRQEGNCKQPHVIYASAGTATVVATNNSNYGLTTVVLSHYGGREHDGAGNKGNRRSQGASEHNAYWEQPFSQPYFDNSSRRDVTSTVGQTAHLHCRVRNLGDRAVSWIRKRDLHILTVGILTYTNDQRFQSLHTDGSDEWTLKVASPQTRDSGIYECQVSTEPKISQAFKLSVVVSKAKIIGNSELYIKSGSDINLTCIVLQTPDPPSFIYWYRGGNVINYSQRGGISVVTEKQTRTSRLLISRALPTDSGNYTCSPSSSDAASVLVHVLNGEQPAAMQHGNNSSAATRWRFHLLLALVVQCTLVLRR